MGWWNPATRKREGGLGFHHVAELAEDYTPTQGEKYNGRQPLAIDAILLNKPLADAYMVGSYRVHEWRDPSDPESDHKRISATLDL